MTPEKRVTSSWVQYYSEDHECDYWYNEQTGESTWESPHKVKQYPVEIQEEDHVPVIDFSFSEEFQDSIPTSFQLSKRSLLNAFDKEEETTRIVCDQLPSKEDENVPSLVRCISNRSLCSILIAEEETKSPVEVSWNLLADRRKSRLLKRERKQRKRMRIYLRILSLLILFLFVIVVVVCIHTIKQRNNNEDKTTNQMFIDETITIDFDQSRSSYELNYEGIEYNIVNLIEEINPKCVLKRSII